MTRATLAGAAALLAQLGCTTPQILGPDTGTDDNGTDADGGTDSATGDAGTTDTGDTTDSGGDGGTDSGDSGTSPYDCDNLPELPLEYDTLYGFTGSEDWAFDGEGHAVSVDYYGNLVAEDISSNSSVLVPGIGYTAGTRYLPDGDLVIADVGNGRIIRVTPEGAQTTLTSGLSYPNGVEVDMEGWVYVAEHDAGNVRQIDPETGDSTIIADGLYNPNGLRFSTDWSTLYVTSFGGGTVHAITESRGEWQTELFGTIPGIDLSYPEPCEDLADGDVCTMIGGGYGVCTDTGEAVSACEPQVDEDACADLDETSECTTTDPLGNAVTSRCTTPSGGTDAICPAHDGARVEPCEGKSEYSNCRLDGVRGYCVESYEQVMVCITTDEYNDAYTGTCSGADEGDACTSDYPPAPWDGTCINYYGNEYCQPYGTNWSENGGIDGINVDECENIYITEYITGDVWRFPAEGTPDGALAEVVVTLPSYWIPNMRWGSGVGGWDTNLLYVMERDAGQMYALDLGVGGGEVAYP